MYSPTILIINPNTNDDTTRMLRIRAEEHLRSGFVVQAVTAAHGPKMITTENSLAAAAGPVIAAAAAGIEQFAPAAVIVAAFGDPGVPELRAQFTIPVIGIGEAAIRTASMNGKRFAIATTTADLATSLLAMVTAVAPDSDFAGLFITPTEGEVLTLDPARQTAELAEMVDKAASAGAQTVIIGGAPLSRSAQLLTATSRIPIIEPLPAALAAAIALLAVRA